MPLPAGTAAGEQPLEQALLGVCRGNRQLFERLLHYERSRHPYLGRAELLRRAIDRYEHDNR
jgi:hypothetical protein